MKINKDTVNRISRIVGIALTVLFIALAAYFAVSFFSAKQHQVTLDPTNVENHAEDNSFSMGGIALPAGNYVIAMDYSLTGTEAKAYLNVEQEKEDMMIPLPVSKGGVPVQFMFMIDHPVTNGRITVNCEEGSQFKLLAMSVISDKYIFTDHLIYAVLCLFAAGVVWMLVISIKKGADPLTILAVTAMFLVTTLPFVCAKALPVGGDLRGHMMRIDGVYLGLQDGQFPVVINPQWDNRHGQLGVLYPSLFLYPVAALRLMKMSIYGAVKVMMIVTNAVSALLFYKASTVLFEKRWMRLLSTFLMTFEFSRLYAITYGGKLGGALNAEMFIPLVIAGLVDILYKERRKWYYLPIGLAGVFCTHIISSLLCSLLVVIITLVGIRKLKEKAVWVAIGKSVVLFAVLVAGTYAAFVRYWFLDWGGDALTWRDFEGTLWRFSDFFFDNRWTYAFVITAVCAVLFAIYVAGRHFHKEDCAKEEGSDKGIINGLGFIFPVFVAGFIFFWMATAYFPWHALRNIGAVQTITDNLQSSNRFLGIAGTLGAMCFPELLARAFTNKGRNVVITGVAGAMVIYCIGGAYYATHEFLHNYIKIYDETVAFIDKDVDDYLPVGTIPEYYKSDAGYVSDDSVISSLEYRKVGTHVFYRYTASAAGEYVEFPLFYYDGYMAVDGSGKSVAITKSDRNKIRIDLPECTDANEINIRYVVPKVYGAAYAFSMIAWLAVIAVVIVRGRKGETYEVL